MARQTEWSARGRSPHPSKKAIPCTLPRRAGAEGPRKPTGIALTRIGFHSGNVLGEVTPYVPASRASPGPTRRRGGLPPRHPTSPWGGSPTGPRPEPLNPRQRRTCRGTASPRCWRPIAHTRTTRQSPGRTRVPRRCVPTGTSPGHLSSS